MNAKNEVLGALVARLAADVTHCEWWRSDPTSPHANARKTHCKRGHPFDAVNTRARRDGGRLCRTCARDQRRARYPTTHDRSRYKRSTVTDGRQ